MAAAISRKERLVMVDIGSYPSDPKCIAAKVYSPSRRMGCRLLVGAIRSLVSNSFLHLLKLTRIAKWIIVKQGVDWSKTDLSVPIRMSQSGLLPVADYLVLPESRIPR